jgi:Spy/CpxP family protein refolding chaperone
MKLTSQIFSTLILAGALLAVPALAAGLSDEVPGSEVVTFGQMGECPAGMEGHHMGPGGDFHFNPAEHFIKELNISDAQLEKMASLKDQYEASVGAKKAELHSLYRQVFSLMSQPTIDRGQITAVHDKINGLKTDLGNARLNYQMDRADVFTADQRKQLRHMMLAHQMMPHHGHHKKWGHNA